MSSENTSNSALNTWKGDYETVTEAKEVIRKILREGPARIKFIKKDGTERIMRCTLQEGVAIPYEKKTDREKVVADNILPVWDLEAEAWRSINVDTIISIILKVRFNANS